MENINLQFAVVLEASASELTHGALGDYSEGPAVTPRPWK